jgi:hypothetical protein
LRSARPGALKFATGSRLALIGWLRLLGCSFTVIEIVNREWIGTGSALFF